MNTDLNVNVRNVIVELQNVLTSNMYEYFEDRVYIDKDFLIDLYGKTKTPYAVIDFHAFNFEQADNLRTYDYLRAKYNFSIIVCTRARKKYDAIFDENNGLLVINDKIYTVLANNETLNGLIDDIVMEDISTETGKPEDASLLYEALSEIRFNCYKDICLR